MSTEHKIRWDRQHASTAGSFEPAGFLRQVHESGSWQLPVGRALDIACGKGRNAIYLAQLGYDVTAIDISPVGIAEGKRRAAERGLVIDWKQADLEAFRLEAASYDLVVNINYLQRSLFAEMKHSLRRCGCVIFETYLSDQAALGHPKNPDHLLRPNELLDAFRDFRILCYREGLFTEGGESAYRAGILAQARP